MGQLTISHSSDEAEYRAVENTMAEPTLVRQLLCDLSLLSARATLVYCDNVSDIYLSSNSNYHQCTKHIEIDIHFVRDQVALGLFRVPHVPSRFEFADIFTKGLPSTLFREFVSNLNVRFALVSTARAVRLDIYFPYISVRHILYFII